MKEITAYQCEICDEVLFVENTALSHESDCLAKQEYEEEKSIEQLSSLEYLDSFRGRVNSVNSLLNLIESEMPQIIDAIKITKFYGEDCQIQKTHSYTFSPHGFASANRPKNHCMTHSAPVGKKKHSMYPKGDHEEPLAFEVEISYEYDLGGKNFNVLDEIGGVNTGGGGSARSKINSGRAMHYYTTFWIEDFPNGLTG